MNDQLSALIVATRNNIVTLREKPNNPNSLMELAQEIVNLDVFEFYAKQQSSKTDMLAGLAYDMAVTYGVKPLQFIAYQTLVMVLIKS